MVSMYVFFKNVEIFWIMLYFIVVNRNFLLYFIDWGLIFLWLMVNYIFLFYCMNKIKKIFLWLIIFYYNRKISKNVYLECVFLYIDLYV